MAFSSMAFLFAFLPLCLLCYFLIPTRFRGGRNFVLLVFSLVFYAWGGLRLLPVLLASCVLNWGAALLAAPGRKHRKIIFPAARTAGKYPDLPALGGRTSPRTGGGESKGGADPPL